MKNLLLIALFGGLTLSATAQDQIPPPPESKPDKELTCEEADARILKYKNQNGVLQTNLDGLKADILKAEGDLTTAVSDLKKCNDDIYSLIGANEASVNAFREALGRIEGRVREMQRLSNDQLADRRAEVVQLDNDLRQLATQPIAVLPEFFDKISGLARDIKGLYREHSRPPGYTVGTWADNRDCLWNISGRTEIYGDPHQWPKIWQANTDKIKNPDVIQPGWVLNIPAPGPKTDEEMKAERRYWRKKKAAMMEAQAAAGETPAAPTTTAAPSETGK
ncbi:MAG: LysM peptidoglycan-binding domain-containing protein [Bradyrhizobiaceae bacterium]|nr:LysM peptidoglycan-binding domain-containing protein [Bradyrhizobiaceae bacterium]